MDLTRRTLLSGALLAPQFSRAAPGWSSAAFSCRSSCRATINPFTITWSLWRRHYGSDTKDVAQRRTACASVQPRRSGLELGSIFLPIVLSRHHKSVYNNVVPLEEALWI